MSSIEERLASVSIESTPTTTNDGIPPYVNVATAIQTDAIRIHILDLSHSREDAAINLNESGENYLSVQCQSSNTIQQLKHSIACQLAARRNQEVNQEHQTSQLSTDENSGSSSVPCDATSSSRLPLLLTSQMRLVYLCNRTHSSPCRPLTDLFVDSKTLFDYDVLSDSWILLKRKYERIDMPRLEAEEDEEGDWKGEENQDQQEQQPGDEQ